MEYTQVRETLFEEIQINAGIMLADFDPTDGSYQRDDIIGATSGGVSFSAEPEYSDFGEDIDNVPNNTKELKHIESVTATMSGTFVSASDDLVKRLVAAAELASGKVTPRADLEQSDFQDIWWVGDYNDGSGGFIAIHLINALSTGGFKIQTTDRAKGTYEFEFTGHYSISDVSIVPYEVYIADTAGPDAKLASIVIANASLSPSFSSTTKNYAATTEEASGKVTVTAKSSAATVAIEVNGTTVTNGGTASWETGSNVVVVDVTNSTATDTYTVVVTRSE